MMRENPSLLHHHHHRTEEPTRSSFLSGSGKMSAMTEMSSSSSTPLTVPQPRHHHPPHRPPTSDLFNTSSLPLLHPPPPLGAEVILPTPNTTVSSSSFFAGGSETALEGTAVDRRLDSEAGWTTTTTPGEERDPGGNLPVPSCSPPAPNGGPPPGRGHGSKTTPTYHYYYLRHPGDPTQVWCDDESGRPVTVDAYLATPPLKADIYSRPGPGGRPLSYLSGECVSRTLNEAFGFDGWNLQILHTERVVCEPQPPLSTSSSSSSTTTAAGGPSVTSSRPGPGVVPSSSSTSASSSLGVAKWHVAYTAQVRITHQASQTFREDVGAGDATDRHLPTALQHALKASITDALKRAARHFGEKLGNSLYQPSSSSTTSKSSRSSPPTTLAQALAQVEQDRLRKFQLSTRPAVSAASWEKSYRAPCSGSTTDPSPRGVAVPQALVPVSSSSSRDPSVSSLLPLSTQVGVSSYRSTPPPPRNDTRPPVTTTTTMDRGITEVVGGAQTPPLPPPPNSGMGSTKAATSSSGPNPAPPTRNETRLVITTTATGTDRGITAVGAQTLREAQDQNIPPWSTKTAPPTSAQGLQAFYPHQPEEEEVSFGAAVSSASRAPLVGPRPETRGRSAGPVVIQDNCTTTDPPNKRSAPSSSLFPHLPPTKKTPSRHHHNPYASGP